MVWQKVVWARGDKTHYRESEEMSRYYAIAGVGLMAALALVAGQVWAEPIQGSKAPLFKAKDLQDREVNLEELLQKDPDPLILFFFSLDSGQIEASKLRDIHGTYGNVVAVGVHGEPDAFKRFARELAVPYFIVREAPAVELYGPIPVLPMTIFISRDAYILEVLHGGGPGMANVIAKIAQVYLQKGDTNGARTIADKAIQAGEDAKTARSTIGYANVIEGKLDEAEAEFKQIDAPDGLARVALERGDLNQAIALSEQAGPENGYAQTVRGTALMRAGRLDEAAQAFDAATGKPAENWQLSEAYNGRGRILQQTGEADQAVENYQKAIALDAYNVTAFGNESAAYREQGELEKAAEVLQLAKARGKEDPLIALMFEQVQADLKALKDAERNEMIRKQVETLVQRYKELQQEGRLVPEDEWTSRRMVLAFLPADGGAFFERAGTDVVLRRGLADTLNGHSRIQVVEREMIDKLLQELNLGSSELADPDTQLRLGRLFAAQLLGFVEFAQVGADRTMFVRMVDPETTTIECQVVRDVTKIENLAGYVNETAEKLAGEIIRKRPLQGLIADVTDEGVLINLGANHGVEVGLEFFVFEGGEPLTVKVGGRVVRRSMKQVAVIRVKEVEEEISICDVVPDSLKEGAKLVKEMKIKERLTR